MKCPYCGGKADFVTSKEFYGQCYGTSLYICHPCDARVGTHSVTKKALGTLANEELRGLRKKCHGLVDPYWKSGKYTRTEVYERMAIAMGLSKAETHIGMFDEGKCLQLINFFVKQKESKEEESLEEAVRELEKGCEDGVT